MTWVKELGATAARDGWRDDFPLAHDLPTAVKIDCRRLQLPIHPMFAVRLRVFVDWHRAQGREVEVAVPIEPSARNVFKAMRIDPQAAVSSGTDAAIMPVTRMTEFLEVEEVAACAQELLEYQLTDVSPLGQATFMAISELCGNAIDHGRNALGAYAAIQRVSEPKRQVSIA